MAQQIHLPQDRLDRLGIVASTACAVHCVLLPLVLSLALLLNVRWIADERVEWTFLIVSILIGVGSLLPGYRRRHRHRRCLAFFGVGIASLLAARLLPDGHSNSEALLGAGGAAFIVCAHAVNRQLCRQCGTCEALSQDARSTD